MSTIKVNEILDASGGNTAQINGATPTAYNTMGRNKIINGSMMIDQRGSASTPIANGAASNTYFVDRWHMFGASASKMTGQQSSTAPTGYTYSSLVTSSAATTPGASDAYGIRQVIEGFNTYDLDWGTANAKTVTISFWVRSSITGTYAFSVFNTASGGYRSYVATYTIASADTWEQKTITIPGNTSGTWNKTNGVGIQCWWDLGSGSNFNTTAGAWNTSLLVNTSAQTNWIGTSGATFYITGVQLEVGSVATEFERRPYGTELALCQRYYELNAWGATAIANSSTQFWSLHTFRVTKRAAPTASLTVTSNIRYREFGISDRDAASPSIGGSRITTHGANVVLNGFSGLTANALAAVNYTTSGDDGEIFAFSAEL